MHRVVWIVKNFMVMDLENINFEEGREAEMLTEADARANRRSGGVGD